MAVPLNIILPSGVIAVYGAGAEGRLPSGILIQGDYKYGTVYHIWAGGETYVYGNNVVYWKDGNENCRVVTENNDIFTLLPARLVTIDNPII